MSTQVEHVGEIDVPRRDGCCFGVVGAQSEALSLAQVLNADREF
jgi:hypothetical protein